MTGLEVLLVSAVISLVSGVFREAFRKREPRDMSVGVPDPVVAPAEGQEIGVVFGTVLIEDLAIIQEAYARYGPRPGPYHGLQLLEINAYAGLCLGTIDGVVSVETRHDDGRVIALVGGRSDVDQAHPEHWMFDRVGANIPYDLQGQPWQQHTVQAEIGVVQGNVVTGDITISDGGEITNDVYGRIAIYSGLQSWANLTALASPTTPPPIHGTFRDVAVLRWTGGTRNPGWGFEHGYGGPRMRQYSVWVERILRESITGAYRWEYARARIPASIEIGPTAKMSWYDLNPALALREILTNQVWGVGLAAVDDVSFGYAAAVLESEGFGVSFRLSSSSSAEQVVEQLLATVNGVLYEDESGLLSIRLVRELSELEIAALRVIDASNCASLTWQEPVASLLPTSVRVRYWSPVRRAEVSVEAHNDALVAARSGQISWAEVYAFGVADDATIERLVSRELAYRTRPAAAIEARVTREAAGVPVRPGWAVVVDWEYAPPTVCRVASIDWGTSEDEWVTLRLVEDVFVDRGVVVQRPDPTQPDPTNPAPLQVARDYEQIPYWWWAHQPLVGFDEILGITGAAPTVWVRGVAYGEPPNAEHTAWRLAEQAYAGGAPVRYQGPAGFTPKVVVRATHNRSAGSTVGAHTLLLNATGVQLQRGDILRVPVSYPELDWTGAPDECSFNETYEYVAVLEATEPTGALASAVVARGVIDTQVAPTITTGDAWIVGRVDLGAPGTEWSASGWQPYGIWGHTDSIPRNPNNALHGAVDARGLGRIGAAELDWDDATPAFAGRVSESVDGVYVARARRPVSPGSAWVEESAGTVTVWATPRTHGEPQLRPAGLAEADVAAPNPGIYPGDTLELAVFDDSGDWQGTFAVWDGEKFTLSPAMLSGIGGPWSTTTFVVFAIRRDSDSTAVACWQPAVLELEFSAAIYDETAFGQASALATANEQLLSPAVYDESATGRARARATATEELIVTAYDETATGRAQARGTATESVMNAPGVVGSSTSVAGQPQTAGGTWTPSFGAIGGATNGDQAWLCIASSSQGNISAAGWSVVERRVTSYGSLQVFARDVQSGWDGGNTSLSVPHEAVLACALLVTRPITQAPKSGATVAVTGAAISLPGVSTGLPHQRVLSVAVSGYASGSGPNIGDFAWPGQAIAVHSSGGSDVSVRIAATTHAASAAGIVPGTSVVTAFSPTSDTLAIIHLATFNVT